MNDMSLFSSPLITTSSAVHMYTTTATSMRQAELNLNSLTLTSSILQIVLNHNHAYS